MTTHINSLLEVSHINYDYCYLHLRCFSNSLICLCYHLRKCYPCYKYCLHLSYYLFDFFTCSGSSHPSPASRIQNFVRIADMDLGILSSIWIFYPILRFYHHQYSNLHFSMIKSHHLLNMVLITIDGIHKL